VKEVVFGFVGGRLENEEVNWHLVFNGLKLEVCWEGKGFKAAVDDFKD